MEIKIDGKGVVNDAIRRPNLLYRILLGHSAFLRTVMKHLFAALLVLHSVAVPGAHGAARLKELISLEGVRDNQLMGYGLVVGLAGTGDRRQTVFSAQSLTNLLERMGLTVDPTTIQVKNTAAVMVTATLPPLRRPGLASMSRWRRWAMRPACKAGVLLMTGLKGPDGQVYAVAQGPWCWGDFVAGSGGNTTIRQNHPTVGRIPNGAIVERGRPA
jgi:flagellar P-ring protein FlgI